MIDKLDDLVNDDDSCFLDKDALSKTELDRGGDMIFESKWTKVFLEGLFQYFFKVIAVTMIKGITLLMILIVST